LEVKFDDEKAVFGFIRKGVWNTLQQNDLVVNVKLGSGFKPQKGKLRYFPQTALQKSQN